MNTIAIVDWGWVGHVPLYAENLCRRLVKSGWQVHHLCPTPEAAERDLCENGNLPVTCHKLIETLSPTPKRRFFPGLGSFLGSRSGRNVAELARCQSLRESFARLSASGIAFDFVFLPWLDLLMSDQIQPEDLPKEFDGGWGGILINASSFSSVATPKQKRAKKLRKYRVLDDNRLQLLTTLDELALSNLARRYPHASVRWMPDLIEEPVEASDPGIAIRQARESGRQVLVSVGVMHRRKGFLKLLAIAEQNRCPDWHFVIAGPVADGDLSESERQLVSRAKEGQLANVSIVDEQLPVTVVNAFVQSADAVFLGYEDWYQSSNIMTRASHLRTPILSCPEGLLAKRTQDWKLGWVVPDLSVDGISSMLNKVGRQQISSVVSQAKFQEYASAHDLSSLAATLGPLLDRTDQRQAA